MASTSLRRFSDLIQAWEARPHARSLHVTRTNIDALFSQLVAAQCRPAATSAPFDLDTLLDHFALARQRKQEQDAHASPDLNPWTVLRLERNEMSHSRVLAWLLDASASHAQGSLFFRRLLEECGDAGGLPSSCADQRYAVRTEARSEQSRIDVELHGRDFLLHIENKIGADEGQTQTHREAADLQAKAQRVGVRKERAVGWFLTPDGRASRSGDFVAVSWESVVRALTSALEEVSRERPENVRVKWFVGEYLRLLRRHVAR